MMSSRKHYLTDSAPELEPPERHRKGHATTSNSSFRLMCPQDTPKKATDGETKDGATHIDLEGNINSFHYDISAGLEASMTVSESLFDALRHRYHAKVEIFVGTKLEINLTSESSKNISEATVPKSLVRVQALLGLISVGVEARAFLEAVAEIA